MLIFWACTQDTGYSLRFVHKYLFKYIEFKNLRFPFFSYASQQNRCDATKNEANCGVVESFSYWPEKSIAQCHHIKIQIFFPPVYFASFCLFSLVMLLLLLFRFNLFHMCISFDHRKMQLLPFELLHALVSLLPILQIMNVVIEINFQLSETD